MKKLNYIFCKNFKAFYGNNADESTNKIVLDGKNLLLYGENGSGKSSLYWALYTFLQSALKQDDTEVTKYFDPNDDENLRNRYCQDTDGSAIELSFEGDDSNPERIIEISEKYSKSTDNTFVEKTLQNSDFFNYKFLFKLYDFAAGEKIDLFPLFRKEMFPFIQLRSGNASDGWEKIMSLINELPVGIQKKIIYDKDNKIDHYEPEQLQNLVDYKNIFNENLDRIIQDIAAKAKGYLQKLGYNFSLILDFKGFEYNVVNGTVFVEKEKYTVPQIILRIKENTFPYNKQIDKPHIFLNEAKLSAVALSIRLSLLDTRGSDDKAGRILVVDDLMISLDMSNRDKVLDILLEKANDYQIIMMTHDRAFYDVMANRIKYFPIKSQWIFKEIYWSELATPPMPKIADQQDNLNLANKYLAEYEYPSSANCMRKECERILTNILPPEKVYDFDGTIKKIVKLETMINSFNEFCKNNNVTEQDYFQLLEFKDTFLNSLSHNGSTSHIYKRELIKCYYLLEKLRNNFDKIVLCDGRRRYCFRIELNSTTKGLNKYYVETEDLFYVIKHKGSVLFFNDPMCMMSYDDKKIITKDDQTIEKKIKTYINDNGKATVLNLSKMIDEVDDYIYKKTITNKNIGEITFIKQLDGSEILLKDL